MNRPRGRARTRRPGAHLAAPAAEEPWPQDAAKFRMHMIGNAHIDPVWLWPWTEGVAVVLATFRSVLDRMKEHPALTFTASSAQFYEWVAELDPEMLREIRARVREGRWCVVGGWWVEPDLNLSSGEALARQGLYGQRSLMRLLGRMARVGFNPDSFGHPATLPQILAQQRMEGYVFLRPRDTEKELPGRLFWWQSLDGTRLLTYRIPFEYADSAPDLSKRLRDIVELCRLEPGRTLMAFYGVGDHGGGPTREAIASLARLASERGAPRALMSTPERYFDEMRRRRDPKLPIVKDELQHHAVGCYSAESRMKRWNRMAESLLVAGEKLAVIGSVAAAHDYPARQLTEAWKRVLLLQFHDSLAGASLPGHYEVARDGYGLAMQTASQAIAGATQKLAWGIETADPDSEYLVLFNPHPWPAALEVEYELDWPRGAPDGELPPAEESCLEDETGLPVPHQWVRPTAVTGRRNRLALRAELPALGYRQVRLRWGRAPARRRSLRVEPWLLENEHLRLEVRPDGSLTIFDRLRQRQVLRRDRGLRALVLEDLSDTWSHDVEAYSTEIGELAHPKTAVLETGPYRGRLRVRTRWGASVLQTDWLLCAGRRELEARVTLDWLEHQKMLKLSFPVAVSRPRVTYEIPFGAIERHPDGKEEPGQRWVDVSGWQGRTGAGLALINDAKYSYSATGSDLRLTVTRAAAYAHHAPRRIEADTDPVWQDQGAQSFRLLLLPHDGRLADLHVPRRAEELTAPVPVVYQGIHRGSLPAARSFCALRPANVVMAAFKQAEESDDIVIRLYEAEGRAAAVVLDLPLLGRTWRGRLRPFEVQTLRVPRGRGRVREVDLLELPRRRR